MTRTGLLALLVLAFVAGPAAAQDAVAHEPTDAELIEARHSFDVATRAFEAGDYETAVSEFRAALELSGAADLYFNIYLSEERQGELQEAADALDQYLQHGTIDPEQRGLLTGRLSRLRARIASRTPEPTASEEPQTLLASPIVPAVAAVPDVADAQTSPPPPRVTTSTPIAPIVMLAAAGALLVNFGIFAGLSVSENDRLTSACGTTCSSDQVASLNTYDIVADVSWISAAAIGVAGLVLLLVLPPDTHEEVSVAVVPWLGPQSGGLSIGGRL